ncbi:MAG: hypothetical protein IPI29_08620 [Ignavibacteria bacterium]|nr:hypothetical protein [Ignavibacteria bacterium]
MLARPHREEIQDLVVSRVIGVTGPVPVTIDDQLAGMFAIQVPPLATGKTPVVSVVPARLISSLTTKRTIRLKR